MVARGVNILNGQKKSGVAMQAEPLGCLVHFIDHLLNKIKTAVCHC
jgi:hypothetical protein